MASAARMIFRGARISRPADDTAPAQGYRPVVARLRIDPQRLDRALAVVLTVAIELEIWLTGNQPHHRVATSVMGPVLTAAIAFRRRYPTIVGTGAGIWGVVTASLWP